VSSEDTAQVGGDPLKMGIVPAHAMRALFRKRSARYWDLKNFDVIETNEAFASVPLAQSILMDQFGYGEFPWERTNPNGGAIALGHPVGATGARLTLTAALETKRRKGGLALITACVGGGQGVAMILRVAA
jgi:acetyl-CoA acetyltransferase